MMPPFNNINLINKFVNRQNMAGMLSHRCAFPYLNKSKGYCDSSTNKKNVIKHGPGLEHFIANAPDMKISQRTLQKISHPYVTVDDVSGHGRKVYFDVNGCQMNFNDVEVIWSVLKSVGYDKTDSVECSDVVLIMTCAIREGAENKIWKKLKYYKYFKKLKGFKSMKIGLLGCMAERLKKDLLEKEKLIDLVMGPDSYRDLPRLLALTDSGDRAINVLLSQEETYADILPVSLSQNRISAFVSIMRGCDNMCSYCIVPYTRGVERSRPMGSILDEIRVLSDEGVKEVTLLGQNVNSYCDKSTVNYMSTTLSSSEETHLAEGFRTLYKPKKGGLRFADLLHEASKINPEMRIRFTAPHPKDFPDEVLQLINEKKNICNHINLPAQCGSSRVLSLMRRGYTREAYLKLVEKIKSVIPNVALVSDFIVGFCSETDKDFQETLTLLEEVRYNFCYAFPYSMREKTPAHRDLKDDVPQEVKTERHKVFIDHFRRHALEINTSQIGKKHIVLVEGESKRSNLELVGRSDWNTRVVFPSEDIPNIDGSCRRSIKPGDYVEVYISSASSQVMKGVAAKHTSLQLEESKQHHEAEETLGTAGIV